jgi:cytochrome c oxidase subunit 2
MHSRVWMILGILLFVVAMVATRYYEVDLPVWRYFAGKSGSVDPLTLHQQGEFVEGNLGVSQEPGQPLTVRLIAQQYLFVPACVEVPAGVPVRFRMTSADVVHNLSIAGTSFQLKTVPGAVSETTFTFDQPGEHAMPCHEFCGAGHYAMRARVVVVPHEKFTELKSGERRSCAPR